MLHSGDALEIVVGSVLRSEPSRRLQAAEQRTGDFYPWSHSDEQTLGGCGREHCCSCLPVLGIRLQPS